MIEAKRLPWVRWGILGTGRISTIFVKDLLASQKDPLTPVRHIIQAIGTSSKEKGLAFVLGTMSGADRPNIYADYNDLYTDDQVDIVYVGIPHSMHKVACLAAIAAKKHVLCEKPMAINLKEVDEIITAARKKGVFLMEGNEQFFLFTRVAKYLLDSIKEHSVYLVGLTAVGVWTRFLPIVKQLQKLIHDEKAIGQVSRMFCDFGYDMQMDSLPSTARVKSLDLGGGALLDLGIYPLALSNLILDGEVGDKALRPEFASSMTVVEGVDYSVAIVVNYPSKKCLGILSASFQTKTGEDFCRIEGSDGVITLSGSMAAEPRLIRIRGYGKHKEDIYDFEHHGAGLYYEANAAALDILAGKLESDVMPLAETRRGFEIMDAIRKAGGIVYSQDLQ